MAKIINFPGKTKLDIEAQKMLDVSNEIDNIVLKHLTNGDFQPHEVAGLMAHRLGNLLKHMTPEEKELAWKACIEVLNKQAEIEDVG